MKSVGFELDRKDPNKFTGHYSMKIVLGQQAPDDETKNEAMKKNADSSIPTILLYISSGHNIYMYIRNSV